MKIGICGHFMFEDKNCNGQAVKTQNYYNELCKKYDKSEVALLDTNNFKKKIISNTIKCLYLGLCCDTIIIMPTKVLLKPLCSLFGIVKRAKKLKVFYVVVGGWLPSVVESEKSTASVLKKLNGILVESNGMKNELEKKGLTNIVYSPNFSTREPILKEVAERVPQTPPYSFCTFSRVTKEKGILEAIDAIETMNKKGIDCYLDIYGQMDTSFENEFIDAIDKSRGKAKYRGILSGNEIVPKLSEHYALLFPTFYSGEGFPGAVVEAMMGGLPVIATDWRCNSEIIHDSITGLIYKTDDKYGLVRCIEQIIKDDKKTADMRSNAWTESQKYTPDRVMSILTDLL